MTTKLAIKSGVHILWRNKHEIQIGIDPTKSLIVDAQIGKRILELCDGTRTMQNVIDEMTQVASGRETICNLLNLLSNQGLLVGQEDFQSSEISIKKNAVLHNSDARFLAQRDLSHPATNFTNRLSADIHIYGGGRLGMTIALLLATGGFQKIFVKDEQLITASDLSAWGASRIDIGMRRDKVAMQLIERVQAGATQRTGSNQNSQAHRLKILAPDCVADYPWISPDQSDSCLTSDTPHIFATLAGSKSMKSSIIQPGINGCIRCMHSYLTDRDPAWPIVCAQLIGRTSADVSPTGLVMSTALKVAASVSEWFDSAKNQANLIEVNSWPDGLTQNIWNEPHPACGCGWNTTS